MFIIDQFDKLPEATSSPVWDAETARRQFRLSLDVVVALVFAVGLFLVLTLAPPTATGNRLQPAFVGQSNAQTNIFGQLIKP